MATLDATTQAEYAAEVNAVDRAQVIIDALADPVSVKIYDDIGTVIASGTMATPWATIVDDAIAPSTLNDFLVLRTDTPNSGWYLRFESGSRYLQTSFGLTGSGEEAIWSLPSLSAGTQAGMSASVVAISGNRGPDWAAAPGEIYRPAGSTQDFSSYASDPDGDEITFTLSSGGTNGYSITTAGVLTVGTVSQSVTIRVTDPDGLTADHVCAVTVTAVEPSSAIQWEPGHYITTTGGGSAITASGITTIANYVNARSHLKGIVIRPYWPQIEVAQGVYDWSLFDHALDSLNSNKGVWLQLQLTRFNTSSTDLSLVVPSYMLNSTYFGGGHIEDKGGGTYDLDPKVWVQPVMDRLLALIAAFGARYASDTRVRGYVIAELQFDLAQGEDDFDSQTWIDLITEQYIPGTRAAMPTKNVIVYMNYINGNVTNKFAIVRDACITYDCMIGGPDTIPCEGGSTGLKVARGVAVTNGLPVHDCRGEIGIMCSLQQPDLGGRYCTTWTGQQYVEWIYGTQQANVVFWTYIPADSKFTGAMTYIQNNLAASFIPDYPSGFPT